MSHHRKDRGEPVFVRVMKEIETKTKSAAKERKPSSGKTMKNIRKFNNSLSCDDYDDDEMDLK